MGGGFAGVGIKANRLHCGQGMGCTMKAPGRLLEEHGPVRRVAVVGVQRGRGGTGPEALNDFDLLIYSGT